MIPFPRAQISEGNQRDQHGLLSKLKNSEEAGREFINEFSVTFVRHVGENDPVEFLEFRAEEFTSPR